MNIGENVVIWISDFLYHEIGSQWTGELLNVRSVLRLILPGFHVG